MGGTRVTTRMPERPRGLHPRQYGTPQTRAAVPVPVLAWIVLVDGREREVAAEAIGWTAQAVLIRFADHHDRPEEVWVWAGAVTRVTASSAEPHGWA
jgi:hypothetical protein